MGRLGLILLLVSCGTFRRNVGQHHQAEETTKARWAETAAAAKTEHSAVTGQLVRKPQKRVRHLRPDGTPWKEEIELDDSTLTFLATNAATASYTASAAGELDREKKEHTAKVVDTGVKTGWSRWWLLLLLLIPAGLAFWRWRLEPLRRLWHRWKA